jgi:hypothetical protein
MQRVRVFWRRVADAGQKMLGDARVVRLSEAGAAILQLQSDDINLSVLAGAACTPEA